MARLHRCEAAALHRTGMQEAGSCGFCIFNSICIGALHALHEHHDRSHRHLRIAQLVARFVVSESALRETSTC